MPSEIGDALKGLGSAVGQVAGIPAKAEGTWQAPELSNGEVPELDSAGETTGAPAAAVAEADNAVREAIAAAENAAVGNRGQIPVTPSVNPPPVLPTQEPPAAEPPQR